MSTMSHNIHFSAKHIPGKSNLIADALSRFQNEAARRLAPDLNAEQECIPPAMRLGVERRGIHSGFAHT